MLATSTAAKERGEEDAPAVSGGVTGKADGTDVDFGFVSVGRIAGSQNCTFASATTPARRPAEPTELAAL